MFLKKNNGFSYKPKILVAPLDWGLGHATRCIPIIRYLLNSGATVIVAASGSVKVLLQQEFPQIEFLHLPGYNIHYNKRGRFAFTLFLQLPKLCMAVLKEYKWLKTVQKQHKFDAVISDNRLGLCNGNTTCIYITHQLTIKTGNNFTEKLVQKIHYWFINKYSECWVPDNATENSLAGDLSHPAKMPAIPVSYLGILSRFEKKTVEKKYDLLILLSGPEPQRTILENIILKQLNSFNGIVLLVRGLPGNADTLLIPAKNIEVHNHLNAADLNNAFLQSSIVVCRSGYTTIMDLVTLQKKAVLIPTPGQTEQEYLSSYLEKKKIFYSSPQKNFLLADALNAAAPFACNVTLAANNNYADVITAFLQKLTN